jgi:hypothetical protein
MTQANLVCIHLAPKYVFDATGAFPFSLESDAPGQNLPKRQPLKTRSKRRLRFNPKHWITKYFFDSFETTGDLDPYLAYEKSTHYS